MEGADLPYKKVALIQAKFNNLFSSSLKLSKHDFDVFAYFGLFLYLFTLGCM
jgi:hypothetical protein